MVKRLKLHLNLRERLAVLSVLMKLLIQCLEGKVQVMIPYFVRVIVKPGSTVNVVVCPELILLLFPALVSHFTVLFVVSHI
jgi:hypothetical protein